MIGATLGPYRVLSALGRGGMGEVFLAEDSRLGRQVALKFVPAEAGDTAELEERLFREARAASALNHPNIVTIHDIGEAEGGKFIVMEFVAGRTLRDYVAEHPSVDTIVGLVSQAARALGCAHAANITHRDIKPENIMIRDDGYVKVVDFGLARAPRMAIATGTVPASTATPGAIVGTVRYMSPEQVKGQPLTTATDVFSLGLVLYELLTGRHPFGSETRLAHVAALASLTPVSPSRHSPHVPPALDELVLRMLAKEARARPTADQVVTALGTFSSPTARITATEGATSHRVSVGREAEQDTLQRALDEVQKGRSRMILIAGEAGMGKTTLVEAFLAGAAERNPLPRIARGRCSERMSGTGAYLPLIEALQELVTLRDPGILNIVQTIAPHWYTQLASASGSEQRTSPAMTPDSGHMKRELFAFLQEISRERAIVLFLDDLQWVDASTVDIIAYLVDRSAAARVLVVGTFRPTEVQGGHYFADLRLDSTARGLCSNIVLHSLSRQDVDRYIALTLPDHSLPNDVVSLVYRRTEGHPLFMADLLRYFKDNGVIALKDGTWVLAEPLETVVDKVPQSVQGMVSRKVMQLTEDDRRVLVAAAVQGDEFNVAVLAAALGADAADIEEQLEPLERLRGIVQLRGEEELPDRTLTARYRFVHALYQNALYSSLRPARRAALSRSVAQSLLRFHTGHTLDIAAQLAFLFEAARDYDEATQHFLAAASAVLRLGAPAEGTALARRGLSLIDKLPYGESRDQRELALRLALGAALNSGGGHRLTEVLVTFDEAQQVAQRLGQQRAVLQVLVGYTWSHLGAGDCKRAHEIAKECVRQADAIQDLEYQAGAHLLVGVTSEYVGDFRMAQQECRTAISLSDSANPENLLRLMMLSPAVFARCELAFSLFFSGRFSVAFATLDQTLALARQVAHPVTTGFVLGRKIDICLRAGLIDEATPFLNEYVQHHLENPTSSAMWVPLMRGWQEGFRENGSVERAVAEIVDSRVLCAKIGFRLTATTIQEILAEVLFRHGKFDESAQEVEIGLQEAQATGDVQYVPELLRLKAAIHLRKANAGDSTAAAAETALRESIRIADEQGAGFWALRSVVTLSEWLAGSGRFDEAIRLLGERCAQFKEEPVAVADLIRARALFEQLS